VQFSDTKLPDQKRGEGSKGTLGAAETKGSSPCLDRRRTGGRLEGEGARKKDKRKNSSSKEKKGLTALAEQPRLHRRECREERGGDSLARKAGKEARSLKG